MTFRDGRRQTAQSYHIWRKYGIGINNLKRDYTATVKGNKINYQFTLNNNILFFAALLRTNPHKDT